MDPKISIYIVSRPMTVEPLHHLIYMKTLTHNFNDIPLFLDLKIDTKWFELTQILWNIIDYHQR